MVSHHQTSTMHQPYAFWNKNQTPTMANTTSNTMSTSLKISTVPPSDASRSRLR